MLRQLESRDVPARYIVDITGPFKVSGGNHVVTLAATPSFGTFDADTPADAARAALGLFSGGVDMSWQGQTASYPFAASDVGSKADRKAYALWQTNPTGSPLDWRVGLEDLAAPNMQSLGVDWDYNDQYWKILLTEVTSPVVSIAAGTSASESGRTPGEFMLTRTEDGLPLSSPLTVTLNYGGGTRPAALGVDYSAPTTVTFEANKSTATFSVTPLQDNRVEDTETIQVTVASKAGVYQAHPTLGQRQTSIALADDPPIVSIERIGGDAVELTGILGTFRFTRTGGNPSLALPISYTLSGTAIKPGELGADYGLSPAGTLQFAANKTTVDLVVNPIADGVTEGPETVVVTVNTNTTLNTNGHKTDEYNEATMTIADDPRKNFLVDTTADTADANLNDQVAADANGKVSLRAAIEQANFNAIPVNIGFDPNLFGLQQTINLAGKLDTFKANIALTGPGKNLLTITSQGLDGVFSVAKGSISSIAELSILNSANISGSGTGLGGAIDNRGELLLRNVKIEGCRAGFGGGIYSNNKLAIDSSEVIFNSAVVDGGGLSQRGGGIGLEGGTAKMKFSTVSGNSAPNRGGGIAIITIARLDATDSVINGNTALFGGGVYVSGGTFHMTAGSLSFNNATQTVGDGGGGIFQSGGGTKLLGVLLSTNKAVTVGGLAEVGTGTFDVRFCDLIENEAPLGKGPKVFAGKAAIITGANNGGDGFDPNVDVDR